VGVLIEAGLEGENKDDEADGVEGEGGEEVQVLVGDKRDVFEICVVLDEG
jgi:hypothetical protein